MQITWYKSCHSHQMDLWSSHERETEIKLPWCDFIRTIFRQWKKLHLNFSWQLGQQHKSAWKDGTLQALAVQYLSCWICLLEFSADLTRALSSVVEQESVISSSFAFGQSLSDSSSCSDGGCSLSSGTVMRLSDLGGCRAGTWTIRQTIEVNDS